MNTEQDLALEIAKLRSLLMEIIQDADCLDNAEEVVVRASLIEKAGEYLESAAIQ